MKNEKKALNTKDNLLTSLLVLLTIAFIVSLLIMFSRINYRNKIYKNEVRVFTACISREDYLSLVDDWQRNLRYGITAETNPEFKEVYAIAEYYYLLPEYRVFKEKGYTEKVAEYEERLKKDRENMGELEVLADDFDARFGL